MIYMFSKSEAGYYFDKDALTKLMRDYAEATRNTKSTPVVMCGVSLRPRLHTQSATRRTTSTLRCFQAKYPGVAS